VRVVFLGSGAFAIPSFEALIEAGHEVAALVSQPDREKGRGRHLSPPPLKPIAEGHGVPVLQPRRIREPAAQEELRRLAAQVQVVVAYGQILPRSVIDIPPLGTINVHASLLPRYRGAAPVQWAIVNGESETGVTTMRIDEGLDTGPILLQRPTSVGAQETAPELEGRLAGLGATLLLETLAGLADGTVHATPQDGSKATLAPLIRKEDGRLDFSLPAEVLERRIRGFHPWPGAFTLLHGQDLKVLRARAEPGPATGGAPLGTVVSLDRDGIVVACAAGTRLRLIEVQPASRKAMPAAAFAAGARLVAGARLG
jgi:methionyl-tRNA formyltransferase